MFAPAGQIVDEALLAVGESPICGLANRSSLLRLANRHRQRLRPAEPTGIDFDLNQENIPGRLQHEMRHSHGANNNWLVCSPLLFNLLQILLYTLQPSFGDPNSSEQSLYKIYIKSYLQGKTLMIQIQLNRVESRFSTMTVLWNTVPSSLVVVHNLQHFCDIFAFFPTIIQVMIFFSWPKN